MSAPLRTVVLAGLVAIVAATATSLVLARLVATPAPPAPVPKPTAAPPGEVPAGTIVAFGGTIDPAALRRLGWLPCDGAAYHTNEFPRLHASIRTAWGKGEADDEFRVPDLRGVFLRGVDGDAGRDPDRDARTAIAADGNAGNRVGSYQADAVGRHAHPVSIAVTGDETGGQIRGGTYTRGGSTTETASQGGNETRPKNAAVEYLIKY